MRNEPRASNWLTLIIDCYLNRLVKKAMSIEEIAGPRGGTVFHDGSGYIYRKQKEFKFVSYLNCAYKRCPGRGCILPKTTKIKATKAHNHEPDNDLPAALLVRDRILQRCRLEATPVRDIYNEEISRVGHLANHEMLSSMSSAMYRARTSASHDGTDLSNEESDPEISIKRVPTMDMEVEKSTVSVGCESENILDDANRGTHLQRSVGCGPEVSQGSEYDSDSQQFSSGFQSGVGNMNSSFLLAFSTTSKSREEEPSQNTPSDISAIEENSNDLCRSIASQTDKPPSRPSSSQTETSSKVKHTIATMTSELYKRKVASSTGAQTTPFSIKRIYPSSKFEETSKKSLQVVPNAVTNHLQAVENTTYSIHDGPKKKYLATIQDANNQVLGKSEALVEHTASSELQLKKDDITVAIPVHSNTSNSCNNANDQKKRKLSLSSSEMDCQDTSSSEPPLTYINEKNHVYKVQHSRVTDEESLPSSCSDNAPKQFKSCETQTCVGKSYYSIDDFRNDKEAMMYFTGLESYEKFSLVLQSLGPAAHELEFRWGQIISVSVEDQLLITLMKLRRNYSDYELSKNFGLSKSTISNIIVTWINFMYIQWSELKIWPSRELVDYYMPNIFKSLYPPTRVMIDTAEVLVPKPKSPTKRKATLSEKKGRTTMKFLVGASPGGLLSFCSSAFAGSTVDREIVEYCELPKICDAGDIVIADESFEVQDLFALDDICVCQPNSKAYLPGLMTASKEVLGKRLQVERISSIAKTFKILSQELTQYYVPLCSRIFFVCLMLCNFREVHNKKSLNFLS